MNAPMTTDDALIARLRGALDELTDVPAAQPIVVPSLDTVVVPLDEHRHRRWAVAGSGLLTAAAIAGFVVLATRPSSPDGAGSQSTAPVQTTVAPLPEGGLPTYTFDDPGYQLVKGPEVQRSGSALDPVTVFGTEGNLLRTVRVTTLASLPTKDTGLPDRPAVSRFTDSTITAPVGTVREWRLPTTDPENDNGLGLTNGKVVELIWTAPDRPVAYLRTVGLTDDELTRLLAGLELRPDWTWRLSDDSLGLNDAGPSAFRGGALWWSRFADYTAPDGGTVHVTASSGTMADLLSDQMWSAPVITQRAIGTRDVWVQQIGRSTQVGQVDQVWRAVWLEAGARIEVIAPSLAALDAAVSSLTVRPWFARGEVPEAPLAPPTVPPPPTTLG